MVRGKAPPSGEPDAFKDRRTVPGNGRATVSEGMWAKTTFVHDTRELPSEHAFPGDLWVTNPGDQVNMRVFLKTMTGWDEWNRSARIGKLGFPVDGHTPSMVFGLKDRHCGWLREETVKKGIRSWNEDHGEDQLDLTAFNALSVTYTLARLATQEGSRKGNNYGWKERLRGAHFLRKGVGYDGRGSEGLERGQQVSGGAAQGGPSGTARQVSVEAEGRQMAQTWRSTGPLRGYQPLDCSRVDNDRVSPRARTGRVLASVQEGGNLPSMQGLHPSDAATSTHGAMIPQGRRTPPEETQFAETLPSGDPRGGIQEAIGLGQDRVAGMRSHTVAKFGMPTQTSSPSTLAYNPSKSHHTMRSNAGVTATSSRALSMGSAGSSPKGQNTPQHGPTMPSNTRSPRTSVGASPIHNFSLPWRSGESSGRDGDVGSSGMKTDARQSAGNTTSSCTDHSSRGERHGTPNAGQASARAQTVAPREEPGRMELESSGVQQRSSRKEPVSTRMRQPWGREVEEWSHGHEESAREEPAYLHEEQALARGKRAGGRKEQESQGQLQASTHLGSMTSSFNAISLRGQAGPSLGFPLLMNTEATGRLASGMRREKTEPLPEFRRTTLDGGGKDAAAVDSGLKSNRVYEAGHSRDRLVSGGTGEFSPVTAVCCSLKVVLFRWFVGGFCA